MNDRVLLVDGTDASEDRVILIDKPAGISSFGVVAKVRGKLRAEFERKVKVGHTGTLDPFATGLLVLLTGKMTKKSSEFLKQDKWYEATLKLGYISTTGDSEGEVTPYLNEENLASDGVQSDTQVAQGRVMYPELNTIESVVQSFVGRIQQTPPRYSAIKVNGERAYKLARKGLEFEVPTREVEIYEIKIIRYDYPELEIRCHVSSGTYIRTLAEDIGKALGVGAYLTALRRTKIGKYDVKDAVGLDNLKC